MEVNKIHNMECLAGLKLLDSNSVDLIVTDPPYFIENLKEDLSGSTIRASSKNNIFHNTFDHFEDLEAFKFFMFAFLQEYKRVLKPKAQAYMFVSYHHLDWIITYLRANFRYYKPLIWYKPDIMGVFPNQYGCNYEVILWFRKKDTKGNVDSVYKNHIGNGQRDVFQYNSTLNTYRKECGYHPTPKPVQLIRRFIKNSSNEGDLVLDSFMGSGTTAVASKQLKRNFIGFEINEEYCKIGEKRLEQETLFFFLEDYEKDLIEDITEEKVENTDEEKPCL